MAQASPGVNRKPQVTFVVRNVGAVGVTLGSVTVTGSSSNSGFTGALTVPSLSTIGGTVTSSDGMWSYTLAVTGGGTLIAKGGSATLTITQTGTAANPKTQVLSGEVVNAKITTNVGTFASTQYTVP